MYVERRSFMKYISFIFIFACDFCLRTKPNKAGLTRHKKAKHPQQDSAVTTINHSSIEEYTPPAIHNLVLKVIIERAAKKLSSDNCYSSENHQKFQNFKISTNECLEIWYNLTKFLKVITETWKSSTPSSISSCCQGSICIFTPAPSTVINLVM